MYRQGDVGLSKEFQRVGPESLTDILCEEDEPPSSRLLEGSGELLVVEGPFNFERRRRHHNMVGALVLALGLGMLVTCLTTLTVATLGEAAEVAVVFAAVGSMVVLMVSGYHFERGLNARRLLFFEEGIGLSMPHQFRGWVYGLRRWDQMEGYEFRDHWFFGPSLLIDVNVLGNPLVVAMSMMGYDQVAELVTSKLEMK